ncbi:ABC transporter permease [Devosia rhodophyticola]|uniref:ABC transporter permease n=1 Tax=Devosia rhodophyticola TaxID=3026423 RepID=A0ABY7YVA5_9HYPH|nr:ABC transporter permease [Devosia rhodophyticola]WDR05038.1 ABC transporter permease [Devosia rhodophyticola]
MQFRLEKRQEPSRFMLYATPVAAVVLTMVLGAIIFTTIGFDGVGAVREIFLTPLINPLKWQDLAVKASPLIIIAVGLSIGYRANVWNIGAEGQYIVGALAGTGVALATWEMTGWWLLPLMIIAGVAGGMAYAAVPALLRVKFKVNEILTTLMLTYVSVQLLNYLVLGPWINPTGYGQAQTRLFNADQTLPYIIPGTIVQLGTPIALIVALVAWVLMSKSMFGFQIRVVGLAPHAARYGGFSENRTIWLALLVGGGLAGLAGVLEVAGPFGRMVPSFPTNYGFTAIIVAFLGRLNPLGIVVAGIVLAITFVGGQVAQTTIGLPFPAVGLFQAMMLFLLLAGDILVRYRLRRVVRLPAAGEVA